MARLGFVDGRLVLDPENNWNLKQGLLKSSLVFDAGFAFDEATSTYVLQKGRDVKDSLEYTLNLLESEGIAFRADAMVESISHEIAAKIRGLSNIINQGEEIKKGLKLSQVLPPGFKRPLLPSQRKAVALHATLPFSADFSVPGAGKTWIGYATYSLLKKEGIVKRLFVVGPISSFRPWEEEHFTIFGKQADFVEVKGSKAERKRALENISDHELFLISYHSVSNDEREIAQTLIRDDFMVILDESHNVKQPEAKRTNAILRLSRLAKHRMILTGTPIPRSIEDIYTQFAFLDPDRDVLGQSSDFVGLVDQDESLEALKQRISPFYYRIRKSDFNPKLPRAFFNREYVNMGNGEIRDSGGGLVSKVGACPNQESIYYAIEGRIFNMIRKERERVGATTWEEVGELKRWQRARLLRLLQVASNPALLMKEDLQLGAEKIDSAGLPIYKKIRDYHKLNETPVKLQRAEQIGNAILHRDASAKVLIWTSFILNIYELKRAFHQFSPAVVFGDVAKDPNENRYFNRIDEVSRFKNNEECRVLIANPASLAESVSLHKNQRGEVVCSNAIYLDRTFNGAHYMQSLDRIHRIGLAEKQKVRYFLLHSADTVDLDVDESLTTKVDTMQSFLDDDIRQFSLETSYDDITDGTSDKEDYERVVRRLQSHAEAGKFD